MMSAPFGIRPYLAYVRSSLLGMLAYRLRYFTGILTYLLYISIHFFIWDAVFSSTGTAGGTIYGYTLSEMVTYVVVGWVARSMCFSNLDWDIDDLVRSGQIGVYLVRPVNFQGMMMAQGLGEFLFRALFFTLPIALVVFPLFSIQAPASLEAGILFVLSTFVGFLIFAQVNFLVGLVAFFTKSIGSLIQAKHYLIQLFSGLLLPLSFFPDWAGAALQVLPFQLITYAPMQCYLGKVSGSAVLTLVGQQLFWLIALQILGQAMWRRAAERLTVQGG